MGLISRVSSRTYRNFPKMLKLSSLKKSGVTNMPHSLVKGVTRYHRSSIHEFGPPETGRLLFTYLPAGDCPSGPPFGTFVALKGVPPMDFAKKWNEETKHFKKGTPLGAFIEFQGVKMFNISFESPPIEWLIRQAAGASTDHPCCMPDIVSFLPNQPVLLESIVQKERAYYDQWMEKWQKNAEIVREIDGVITVKHAYHIAELKMKDKANKFSGISLKQMVQQVINTAYKCNIDIYHEPDISQPAYEKILHDISVREAEKARLKAEAEALEAETRRRLAKERKLADQAAA